MILQAFKKKKELTFERHYAAPVEVVWQAWTDPDQLRRWWGPEKTFIPECEMDLRVGGTVRIVTEAGDEMGKYQGTRWPMVGTFTAIEPPSRLVFDARSWTEGEEDGSTIHHTNELHLQAEADGTLLTLHITIDRIGPKAKMAVLGMKWGYKAQLDKLESVLAGEI